MGDGVAHRQDDQVRLGAADGGQEPIARDAEGERGRARLRPIDERLPNSLPIRRAVLGKRKHRSRTDGGKRQRSRVQAQPRPLRVKARAHGARAAPRHAVAGERDDGRVGGLAAEDGHPLKGKIKPARRRAHEVAEADSVGAEPRSLKPLDRGPRGRAALAGEDGHAHRLGARGEGHAHAPLAVERVGGREDVAAAPDAVVPRARKGGPAIRHAERAPHARRPVADMDQRLAVRLAPRHAAYHGHDGQGVGGVVTHAQSPPAEGERRRGAAPGAQGLPLRLAPAEPPSGGVDAADVKGGLRRQRRPGRRVGEIRPERPRPLRLAGRLRLRPHLQHAALVGGGRIGGIPGEAREVRPVIDSVDLIAQVVAVRAEGPDAHFRVGGVAAQEPVVGEEHFRGGVGPIPGGALADTRHLHTAKGPAPGGQRVVPAKGAGMGLGGEARLVGGRVGVGRELDDAAAPGHGLGEVAAVPEDGEPLDDGLARRAARGGDADLRGVAAEGRRVHRDPDELRGLAGAFELEVVPHAGDGGGRVGERGLHLPGRQIGRAQADKARAEGIGDIVGRAGTKELDDRRVGGEGGRARGEGGGGDLAVAEGPVAGEDQDARIVGGGLAPRQGRAARQGKRASDERPRGSVEAHAHLPGDAVVEMDDGRRRGVQRPDRLGEGLAPSGGDANASLFVRVDAVGLVGVGVEGIVEGDAGDIGEADVRAVEGRGLGLRRGANEGVERPKATVGIVAGNDGQQGGDEHLAVGAEVGQAAGELHPAREDRLNAGRVVGGKERKIVDAEHQGDDVGVTGVLKRALGIEAMRAVLVAGNGADEPAIEAAMPSPVGIRRGLLGALVAGAEAHAADGLPGLGELAPKLVAIAAARGGVAAVGVAHVALALGDGVAHRHPDKRVRQPLLGAAPKDGGGQRKQHGGKQSHRNSSLQRR